MSLDIHKYYLAGFPLIVVETGEYERAVDEIWAQYSQVKQKAVWDAERGFQIFHEAEKKPEIIDEKNPANVLRKVDEFPSYSEGGSVTILRNWDYYLDRRYTGSFVLKEMLLNRKYKWRTVARNGEKLFRQIIILCEHTPDIFEDVPVLRFPLLRKGEIKKIIEPKFKQFKVKISDMIEETALGMTQLEMENAVALSIISTNQLDPKVISDYKIRKIRRFYDIEEPQLEEDIGGLDKAIEFIKTRKKALTEEGQKYLLPYPKLMLTVGVPGCGKSLLARVMSNIMQIPLLRLNMGSLFDSLLGRTEKNISEALAIADAMSPIILWLDEIEKSMSGMEDSGRTSGGVPERVFAHILTWLSEKRTPVILYATCNDIERLPSTLLRRGRTDVIFFVDLPNEKEREDIFKIHIRKRKRNPKDFDINRLSRKTKGFTGAEIESIVVETMFQKCPQPFKTDDLLSVVNNARTLNDTRREDIDAIRSWGKKMAVSASSPLEKEMVGASESSDGRAISN